MLENPNILIVDDIAPNIRLVAGLLGPEGYEVSFANSGKKALELVAENDFDLILLDIMMPDIDGIAVCRAIKEMPARREIPIIFLTGKTDEITIVSAFEAGGVDYLHKPVNPVELVERVKTHLELKRARDVISKTNRELREALRLKNQFLSLASHDLKSPLGAIKAYMQLLQREEDTRLGPRAQRFVEAVEENAERMLGLVATFLDKAALEMGHIELHPRFFNVVEVLRPLIETYGVAAAAKGQTLSLSLGSEELWLTADRDRVYQIADNLLSNAVKYSPLGSPIAVSLRDTGAALELRVQDQGPGFSAEDRQKLFGYFQRLSARPTANEPSVGVGLALTRQMAELHGGSIRLESTPGQGALFVVELPKRGDDAGSS